MSNLSELIPAGGGQNNTDFVASGAITSGKPVILNSAGTVTQVGMAAASSVGIGTAVVYDAGTNTDNSIAYDSSSNKVVVGYRSSTTGYGVVGTVSGTSISYGSATAMTGNNKDTRETSMSYDSTNNKVVMSFRSNNDYYGYAIVGTVSGTSISWGTPVNFNSSGTYYTNCIYDSANSKIVIAFQDGGNSQYGTAIVGTVSGTSISFGTKAVFNAAESSVFIKQAYDSSSNKVIITTMDEGNSGRGNAVVGTVSGTSISFGTNVLYSTSRAGAQSIAFDTVANKVVIAYADGGNSDYGTAIVGTVSGTSISFGTAAVFNTASASQTSCSYDTGADRTIISYKNNSPSSGKVIAGAVSGTSISFNTASAFDAPTSIDSVYDSSAGKVVTVYTNSTGRSVVLSALATNLTATNLLGIASAAILDTATGTINTWGSRNEVQTSLTIGSDYYVQSDGTITTASASPAQLIGQAITATQINIKDYTG